MNRAPKYKTISKKLQLAELHGACRHSACYLAMVSKENPVAPGPPDTISAVRRLSTRSQTSAWAIARVIVGAGHQPNALPPLHCLHQRACTPRVYRFLLKPQKVALASGNGVYDCRNHASPVDL